MTTLITLWVISIYLGIPLFILNCGLTLEVKEACKNWISGAIDFFQYNIRAILFSPCAFYFILTEILPKYLGKIKNINTNSYFILYYAIVPAVLI